VQLQQATKKGKTEQHLHERDAESVLPAVLSQSALFACCPHHKEKRKRCQPLNGFFLNRDIDFDTKVVRNNRCEHPVKDDSDAIDVDFSVR